MSVTGNLSAETGLLLAQRWPDTAVMESFTDLKAWKAGLELVCEVFELSKKFPPSELYGLTGQVRKSSNSIIANTAEGFSRRTFADKANKYIIARGECAETESHLLVAIALKFITATEAEKALNLSHEVGRMLSGLIATYQPHS